MHTNDGELKAFIDHELNTRQQEKVKAHLVNCVRCMQKVDAMRTRAVRVGERMASLVSLPNEERLSNSSAFMRYSAYSKRKEQSNMWNKFFTRQYRPAWIVLIIILILGVALISPQVQAFAGNFLGIFRVQRFTVVQVDPGNLPEKLGSSSELESLLSKDIQVEQLGEVKDAASASEAGNLAGIPVRLPTTLFEMPKLQVIPAARAAFNIDLNLVRSVLAELDRSDIQLPDELDGATVNVELPATVAALYGDCQTEVPSGLAAEHDSAEYNLPPSTNCTTLMQLASPTADVPQGLDIAKIGEAFLELTGMTPDEAAHFSKNLDWTTTFVIPIPRNKATFMDVNVDGVSGTYIREEYRNSSGQYLLIWVKDGIVYTLAGSGSASSAVDIANSLAVP
jgi:hypothetical protein